jgi:putative Mg2+ transporter-C (MgtC) family protein
VSLGISGGEGLVQSGELGLAFPLSAAIGTERVVRQKSAGMRTHTIVGVAAALQEVDGVLSATSDDTNAQDA